MKKFFTAYDAGFDAGLNGANKMNCHINFFLTGKTTKDWEKGNKEGSAKRESDHYEKKKRTLKNKA